MKTRGDVSMGKKQLVILLSLVMFLMIIVTSMFYYFTNQKNSKDAIEIDSSVEQKQDGHFETQVISSNLMTPWSIVFYDDIPLISSRDTGQIYEINKDGTSRIVGTIDEVMHRGEGGLLGLTIHHTNLYAYYTTSTDNRVSRYSLSGERGSLSIRYQETILEGLPSASYHNGGRIAFGPDEMLYITVGDAGDTMSAQDLSVYNGKILRMTRNGEIPDDNPFENSLIYSYGHRNPQGITWDEAGVMYSSEFGQNQWDELNIIKAGGNYGWPIVEGMEENAEFELPVQQWQVSQASPSGMTYHDGTLFLANLRGTSLRTVSITDLSKSDTYFNEEYGRIRDVAIAPDGTLWFITNNTDGRGTPSPDDDRIISVSLNR